MLFLDLAYWVLRVLGEKNENVVIMDIKKLLDNGGRRSGTDRRRFSYAVHIPEYRSGIDRRKGLDRRSQRRKQIKHINDKELEKEQDI